MFLIAGHSISSLFVSNGTMPQRWHRKGPPRSGETKSIVPMRIRHTQLGRAVAHDVPLNGSLAALGRRAPRLVSQLSVGHIVGLLGTQVDIWSSLSSKHNPLHGPYQLEHIIVCLRARPCGSSSPAPAASGHKHRDLEHADDSPLLTILSLACLCFPADRNFRRLPQNNSQQQTAFLALSTVACWGF